MLAGELPFLIVAAIAGLALLLGLRQGQLTRQLGREVQELRRQLEAGPAAAPAASGNFASNLDQVERQQAAPRGGQRSSTEKYHYVASLAAEGMDARGIATALQLSTTEVEQLLRLAGLKQGGSQDRS
jgi:DNA-binding NarL/FixJ family response regulator